MAFVTEPSPLRATEPNGAPDAAPRRHPLAGVLIAVSLVVIAVNILGVPFPLAGQAGSASTPGVQVTRRTIIARFDPIAIPGEQSFFAASPDGGFLLVDRVGVRLLRFDASGQLLMTLGPTTGALALKDPGGVANQGQLWYVVDRALQLLYRLDDSGAVIETTPLQPLGIYGPNGLAVDAAGHLFISDTGRNRFLVLGAQGTLLQVVSIAGSSVGDFKQPMALAFARDGTALVADWEAARIVRLDAGLQAQSAWGTGFRPWGVAVDAMDRVYVPDADRGRIDVYSLNGDLVAELGGGGDPALDVSYPNQVIAVGGGETIFVLGVDGIERLDLRPAAPLTQPRSSPWEGAILLILAALAIGALTFGLRRRRPPAASPSAVAAHGDRVAFSRPDERVRCA